MIWCNEIEQKNGWWMDLEFLQAKQTQYGRSAIVFNAGHRTLFGSYCIWVRLRSVHELLSIFSSVAFISTLNDLWRTNPVTTATTLAENEPWRKRATSSNKQSFYGGSIHIRPKSADLVNLLLCLFDGAAMLCDINWSDSLPCALFNVNFESHSK